MTSVYRADQGFTITELLIAMAMALMLMGAMFTSFQTQQKSYLVQEQVAAMQQNARAGMFYLGKTIRMAGYDPTGNAGAGILDADSDTITFTMDIHDGLDNDADSIIDETDEGGNGDGDTNDTNEQFRYALTGGNLAVEIGGAGGLQQVAENIDAIDFVYLSRTGTVLNPNRIAVPAGSINLIRTIQITVVARSDQPTKDYVDRDVYRNRQGVTILAAQNDTFRRKLLTTRINCRNIGL